MFSCFSRAAAALGLAFCLWTSVIVVAPAQEQQQQQAPAQQQQQVPVSTDEDGPPPPFPEPRKPAPAPATVPSPSTQPQPQRTDKRPLAVDENPAMIGKRNVSGGTLDKTLMAIAKVGGASSNDVAIGRQLAAEIDRTAKFIDDPVISEYINRVGQNIVLHSDAKVPFTIKVIDSDEINAFALPGGYFYVNKGLILAVDNEAELAGVMAHETAHVAARHAVRNQARGTAMELGAIVASSVLGGVPYMVFANTANLGLLTAFMKFTRNAEAEADKLGVQYLYAAGYDPNAMATMFEKLEAQNKKKPGAISKAFESHPQPPERRAASIALVSRFPERDEYVINTSEFNRIKARLKRLSNARASTAGALNDNNGPSGRPTLKRRESTPDDTTTTTTPSTGDQQPPADRAPSGPPKLKRNTQDPSSAPQPSATP